MAYCHFCKFIWRYYHLAVRIPSEQVGKSRQLSQAETCHPGQPVALDQWYMPQLLKLLFNSLKMYDPDFGRAFVGERMYSDFDHSAALSAMRCPMLVLHANWKRLPSYGLVGAMDDDDEKRLQQLLP